MTNATRIIDDYLDAPDHAELMYDPRAFAIRMQDDSLAARGILEGDIVVISPSTTPDKGDLCAIRRNMDITLEPATWEAIFGEPDASFLGRAILVRRTLAEVAA